MNSTQLIRYQRRNTNYLIYFLAIEAFNTLVLVYGYVSDFCTATSCPTMNAGEKYVINSIIYDVY
jgi:hypothetical protein